MTLHPQKPFDRPRHFQRRITLSSAVCILLCSVVLSLIVLKAEERIPLRLLKAILSFDLRFLFVSCRTCSHFRKAEARDMFRHLCTTFFSDRRSFFSVFIVVLVFHIFTTFLLRDVFTRSMKCLNDFACQYICFLNDFAFQYICFLLKGIQV